MRRPVLGTLFALACVSILTPVPANAIPIHKHVTTYSTAYVPDAQGYRDRVRIPHEKVIVYDVAPPDSDDDGCPDARDHFVGPGCNPPPPPPEPVTPAVPAPVPTPPTSYPSSTGYSIPSYIVQCESGGSYTAQNPSGAYGAYQIMPSTASAYGCDLSTASGQDQCAAAIYADVGPSAWSCG